MEWLDHKSEELCVNAHSLRWDRSVACSPLEAPRLIQRCKSGRGAHKPSGQCSLMYQRIDHMTQKSYRGVRVRPGLRGNLTGQPAGLSRHDIIYMCSKVMWMFMIMHR